MANHVCIVCDSELAFRWTDTHGVGVCFMCGAPYTILHYDGDKRLDKAPEIALDEEGVEIARRYWTEFKRMVFPAAFDMGILSRRDRSYSGATREDMDLFSEWYSGLQNERAARADHARRTVEILKGNV